MRGARALLLGVFGLLQTGCRGSQAERVAAEAAIFTAIEIAGAAIQAAADEQTERDARKQANTADDTRRSAAGQWRLVRRMPRHSRELECADSDDESCDESEPGASDSPDSEPIPGNEADTNDELPVGPCMICVP